MPLSIYYKKYEFNNYYQNKIIKMNEIWIK